MATIVKKPRKNGIAYLFQVKVTEPLTGEKLVKTKTWNPPKGCTEKQTEREATILADAWEKEVRAQFNIHNPHGELTPDSTFNEVAEKWLEKTEKQFSLNHLERSKDYLKTVSPHIGKIKIGKLTQNIIQNLFDWLDKREKITRTVRSIPTVVRAAMKERNESYKTLIENHKLNDFTICAVLNGKSNVSYEYAKRFAEALKADVNLLFDIQEKRELYAYNTNHHTKGTVRAILSFAKKRRLVTDNYAKAEYIDFPKRTQKEIICMGEEEVKAAYRAILNYEDIRHGTALLTLIFTGLRKGELCGLKWENIDLANRQITVNKSVSRISRHGVIEKDPKTQKSKRTIEIPHILNEQLKKYKEWYYERKAEMGDRWDDSDWVFVNTDTGQRIAPDTILPWVNKVTEKAGLGHWSVHSFRHTNITMKLLNNVPLIEVSGEAGHSRTSTTTDKYGHYLAAHKRVGPAVLDSIISTADEPSKYLN